MSNTIQFTNPPIIEIIFGVELDLQGEQFLSTHFGLYWHEIRERFPLTRDRIVDVNEFRGKLPLPTAVFISKENTKIIQLQENSFFYNWRYKNEEEYPHFEKIFNDFLNEWEEFKQWWNKTTHKDIVPTKYMLGYINFIDKDFGWDNTSDHSKIFTFVNDINHYLGAPELHDIRLLFSLPEDIGTLLVEVDQKYISSEEQEEEQEEQQDEVQQNEQEFLLFRLIATSFNNNEDLIDWFQLSHENIIKAFLGLTTRNAHKAWGLK